MLRFLSHIFFFLLTFFPRQRRLADMCLVSYQEKHDFWTGSFEITTNLYVQIFRHMHHVVYELGSRMATLVPIHFHFVWQKRTRLD